MPMPPLYYTLGKNFEIIGTDDVLEWGRWFETADRHLAKTTVGDLEISTVFLGLDHAFLSGSPLLWETMIFVKGKGGTWPPDDEFQERYSTFDEAKAGHERAVQMVKEKLVL